MKLKASSKIAYAALLSGFVFSLGLGISGMTQPKNVLGFLEILGNWNPNLAFVMVGAILVYSIGYRLVVQRKAPLFTESFSLPTASTLDHKLILGAVLFGVGWGLMGYCPGPALTSLASFNLVPIQFVIAMLLGMFIQQRLSHD